MFYGLCICCIIGSLILVGSYSPNLKLSFIQEKRDDNFEGITTTFGEGLVKKVNRTSILCWFMTTGKARKRTLAVKFTWGKRCDKLVIFSDRIDMDFESVKLNGVLEGRKFLWGKTREALKYLYDHYLNEFHWFYKADDDTYVVVENLRYLLTAYDPEFPIALGERALVKGDITRSYLAGGSGYVLSKRALMIYGNLTYNNESLCEKSPIGPEDVTLGKCMTNSGILLGDTRDEMGRHRFFQNPPQDYIKGIWQKWYPKTMYYKYGKGIKSLSETAVSFHSLKDYSLLYTLEFFIYKLQIFGVDGRFKGPPVAPYPPDIEAIPEKGLERLEESRMNGHGGSGLEE
ncbi:glycoprotein-N-acetylgalactosamine 3-beta-galactosyltransferase 1-like [Palaemon carinicauda]|uniref:glycoprotein-N-acetylgalactosamine 3-beta-galactosyltransferase 1-like n=1 Tax=Palaemon carinicauda TaxID=392227 RepID=UPI0035B695D2